MKKYKRKPTATVIAIQMNFAVDMSYEKWGGKQIAKEGDWLLQNGDEVYTVNRESFAATYQNVSPGIYFKLAVVHAEIATDDGRMPTKEGVSLFSKGDFLVYNNADRTDGYCMSAEKFLSLYEEVAA